MVSQEEIEGSRLRILRAAEAEFAHKGFDGARVDVIAGVAGVNKALIYYYFKSKAGLLEVLFEDFFLQLKLAKGRIARSERPEDQDDYWRAIVRQVFAVTRGCLDLLRVVLLEELKGGPGHDRVVRRWRSEWEAAFLEQGAQPRPDQAVFNFFFEDLNMIMFLLLNEKWSAAMERSPQASEEVYFQLIRAQSDAYWNRTQGDPDVPQSV